MTAHGEASLGTRDAPNLELDELIDQLVQRAGDVRRVQQRLRELLVAAAAVNVELSLDAVLHNLVDAAVELADATYGALAVIDGEETVVQLLHSGMDDATVAEIGGLPRGTGLLGAMIAGRRSVRLDDVGSDPRAAGFPDGHPVMDTLLGTPIVVAGELFGVLYLADSHRGGFTAEDEELVRALAALAGTAITNARLYDESRVQQGWLRASTAISQQILADDGQDPLELVVELAMEIGGAELGTLALLTEDGTELVVEVGLGARGEEFLGLRYDVEGTLAGRAIAEGAPLTVLSYVDEVVEGPDPASELDVGPVMVVPLVGSHRTRGTLTLVRTPRQGPFSEGDLAMAADFATHASIALELAEARAVERRMHVLEDRDRIARDLHDHVIQELFGTGLALEGIASMPALTPTVGNLIQQRVEDIDRTIRRIRTSIFALRGTLDHGRDALRSRVLDLVGELTTTLDFTPAVIFAGAPGAVDDDLVEDVAAVVREALTNVARHAGATSASVDLTATTTELVVSVVDDGCGITGLEPRSGTDNLRVRAERRGGSCALVPSASGGTALTWRVPLR